MALGFGFVVAVQESFGDLVVRSGGTSTVGFRDSSFGLECAKSSLRTQQQAKGKLVSPGPLLWDGSGIRNSAAETLAGLGFYGLGLSALQSLLKKGFGV